jgi:ADP-L-glycero-D-manno-heptose 6-epimerase
MIIITGAAGFIGSALVSKLNSRGHEKIVLVDDFSNAVKNKNLDNKLFIEKVDRENFFDWMGSRKRYVKIIFHIGARTDTTEFDMAVFDKLNLNYSKSIWDLCCSESIPLIYASSAATYGMGEKGYLDDHKLVGDLQPLNPYGISKNEFDKWVLQQDMTPPYWAGLKFFNVYGPNEYHKGRMASVIFHAFNQVRDTGKVKLFKSHHPDYRDGEQLRDFIYVKDVVSVLHFLMNHGSNSGIYNLGTGKARTFKDLARATFSALSKKEIIEYIPTPEDIRDKYQYFTEADMGKLKSSGYDKAFYSLESGIEDYVQNYLVKHLYF